MSFKIRTGTDIEEEYQRVKDFYRENRSRFVKERDPALLLKSIKKEKLILLENEKRQIKGVCATFQHDQDGHVREVGGIIIQVNGFGFQRLLMAIAVFSDWALDPNPSGDFSFAATAIDNVASNINIKRTGFEPVDDLPKNFLEALGIKSLAVENNYYVFDFRQNALDEVCRIIQEPYVNGTIKNRSNEVFHINLDDLPVVETGILPYYIKQRNL